MKVEKKKKKEEEEEETPPSCVLMTFDIIRERIWRLLK
jgi:hypothetical protein